MGYVYGQKPERERLRYVELRKAYENLDERLRQVETQLKNLRLFVDCMKTDQLQRILELEEQINPTVVPKDHPSLDLSL